MMGMRGRFHDLAFPQSPRGGSSQRGSRVFPGSCATDDEQNPCLPPLSLKADGPTEACV